MFWQTAVGATVSCTATVAVQVLLFKLASVTVRVTALDPIFAQVKEVGLADVLLVEQLSKLPPSTSLPVIEALPAPSKYTVMS